MYLVAYGARTPLLALRGLVRLRNIALIVVPALALGIVALVLGRSAIAVAVVPAPLVAPGIVSRMRGRMDLTGALVVGTVILSLVVAGAQVPTGSMVTAFEAYAIPAMVANALPTIRDLLLVPLRVLGWGAFALVMIDAWLLQPQITVATVITAGALFVVGVAAAAAVAAATGRDIPATIAGSGLRDPALATALAAIIAGPDSTGVPLVYGVFCLGLAAFALRRG